MNNQTKGLLITGIGVLAVIPDSLIIRLVDEATMTVVFWRAALSGIAITTFLIITRGPKSMMIFSWPALLFAGFYAINGILYVVALSLTTVAATVFLLAVAPVWALIISRIFLKEPFTIRMIVTVFLTLTGIGVIALGSSISFGAILGNLAALGAAISLATAFTIARSSPDISMIPATALSYWIATIAVVPFVASYTLEAADWPKMLILGGALLPLATCLMAIGPRYITSAEVGLFIVLESIFAPILVWYVLGENPGSTAIIGGIIVLLVLTVSNIIGLRTKIK
ncbi:DMT family transporter [Paracoccaceae bacterium]|nr:DMT family transporter [Paracoccaceae bacterium]